VSYDLHRATNTRHMEVNTNNNTQAFGEGGHVKTKLATTIEMQRQLYPANS